MSSLRFITVLILSFFLLSPLFSGSTVRNEKPLVIFAQDNSSSITLNKDSVFYKTEYDSIISDFLDNLPEYTDVISYSFGENTRNTASFDFNDRLTNLTDILSKLENMYYNRNIGALIIASDGIYNNGKNPVYHDFKLNCPVYTLALGDTIPPRDLFISKIETNNLAFTGNLFPVNIRLSAYGLIGQKSILKISSENEVVYTEEIVVDDDNYSKQYSIELKSEETGILHYNISIDPVINESNPNNNKREFVIEIIENKQKILLLPFSPHPDIAAITNSLQSNQKFEIEVKDPGETIDSLENYNLIILHQLPSLTNQSSNLLRTILEKEIPVLYIVGSQTLIDNLNNVVGEINISGKLNSFEEAQPLLNNNFTLFHIDEDFQTFVNMMPPLLVNFGDYNYDQLSDVLFYQKIKQINTTRPLILFSQTASVKNAFIFGEGIWRWRMYDFSENGDFYLFDNLMNKIVQYLSLQIKNERFVIDNKKIIPEYEQVYFSGQLYNQSYMITNKPEVNIEIIDSEQNSYSFVFDRSGDSYSLNTGILPVGDYKYTAKTELGNEIFEKTGEFSIIKMDIESENTIANHQLLYKISAAAGGELFYIDQLPLLHNKIENNSDIDYISFDEKQYIELINLKLIFVLLIFLLSMEWFLRKIYGAI